MNTAEKIIAALAVVAALYLFKHRKPVNAAPTVDPLQQQTKDAILAWQNGVVYQSAEFNTAIEQGASGGF